MRAGDQKPGCNLEWPKPKVEPPKNPHQPQHPVPLKQSPEPT